MKSWPMRTILGGPRVLLRRLREVMSELVSAQERLDKIVVLIAANMVAEVCSVYVSRADGQLELYATEGLNRAQVHLVQMRIGEGLVGTVAKEAKPLALANAQAHPAFKFFPELGEDMFHAFVGVPILRAGDSLGVLVVQNKAHRLYTEEEVEALQTVSLILAEMIASGELQAIAKPGIMLAAKRPHHLNGQGLTDSVGLGHVVLHEPRVVVRTLVAENVGEEIRRLDEAIEAIKTEIDSLLQRSDMTRAGDHRDVLEAYRMFANDRGWAAKMREAVESGLTAEGAVEKVQNDTRARMLRVSDPYLRERLHDMDDLANRLLRRLAGEPSTAAKIDLPKDAIIVARNMGPAELLDYDRERLRGLVLEEGSPTSHVTIVARALGIATVGQVENVLTLVEQGDAIIVDGASGEVHVRPPADIEAAYAEKVRLRARRQQVFRELRDKPSQTRDGTPISLMINAGLLVDLPHLKETGARGIGLFRTELQFMVAATFPRISEQFELYKSVLDAAGDNPVTFRSLDIGGDKILPYMEVEVEENPAMGWRAIRLTLDRPGLLRSQIRALLMAAKGRELRLMFPMITEVGEFDRAKALVGREIAFLAKHGHEPPRNLKLGAMIEVPAILWQLEALTKRVDFLSIGSNDLLQFMFAVDRGNSKLANRFDALSSPVMKALKRIVEVASAAHVPVTVCGEMAGRPVEALALLALGFRSISMSPASIGPVKTALMAVDLAELRAYLDPLIAEDEPVTDLRHRLQMFAQTHGIAV
jgi:phosphotransferase system enzyme I (PtsP)